MKSCLIRRIPAFLTLVLLAFTGCTIQITGRILNATGEQITVNVFDSRNEPRESFEIPPNSIVEIPLWETTRLSVTVADHQWKYEASRVNSDSVFTEGSGPLLKRLVNLRLDHSGAIYLLLPGELGADSPIPEQPNGYPIMPNRA